MPCGPAACTVSTGWSFCWHYYSRQHRGTCQISGGHPGHHQRPGTWVLFMLTWSPLLSMPAIHALSLEIRPLLGVCHEHQVIRIEALPWYTSVELTRQSLQHQNEEQWAKDRTLMHTNSHTKLLTVPSIDPHTTPSLGVHALDDPQSPFLDPRLLKAHHRTFLWTMKMASVVPLPGTKRNCISSMFTISQMLKSSTRSMTSSSASWLDLWIWDHNTV